ncbi:MAG: hypothetical protein ACRD68_15480 [Pyrinomonadaceae bacterium]
MADDSNSDQGKGAALDQFEEVAREKKMMGRRDFLKGLQKWSAIVIGGAVLGSIAAPEAQAQWVNRRGTWVNGSGGGGSAAWVNRSGGWVNAAGWVNRSGGSAAWVNRSGGGGWVNTRGGWINRH